MAVATSRSTRTSSTPRSLIPAGGDRSRVREEEEIRNRARDTAGGRASFIPGAWVFFLWVSRTFARYVGGRRGFFPSLMRGGRRSPVASRSGSCARGRWFCVSACPHGVAGNKETAGGRKGNWRGAWAWP
jgi:hypothetical protein